MKTSPIQRDPNSRPLNIIAFSFLFVRYSLLTRLQNIISQSSDHVIATVHSTPKLPKSYAQDSGSLITVGILELLLISKGNSAKDLHFSHYNTTGKEENDDKEVLFSSHRKIYRV